METRTLDTVIFFTPRMHALAQFYRHGLNIEADPVPFGDNHLGMRLDNGYLGFDEVEAENAATDRSVGATVWFGVADLEAAYARFVAAGARVRYPPTEKPWGERLASLHDLDGNIIGLVTRIQEP